MLDSALITWYNCLAMMNTYRITSVTPNGVKISSVVVVTSATQLAGAVAEVGIMGNTIHGVEQINCRGCGEHWPCSVDNNRGSYSGIEHAKHGPAL